MAQTLSPLSLSPSAEISAPAALVRNGAIVLATSWVLALSAQMAVPLPFTPVPLTLQTFALMTLVPMLGSRRSIAMVCAYIAQGAAGLPFFSGGRGGIAVLISPTGGYLLGFIAAAALIGFAAEHKLLKGWLRATAVFTLAHALVLATGASALAAFVGWPHAWALGVLPFIPGELIKTFAAATLWNSRR